MRILRWTAFPMLFVALACNKTNESAEKKAANGSERVAGAQGVTRYGAPEVLKGDLAPIEYETETLPNGLRVVYAPLRQAPVVHVRVLYHVGSKDERPDRQGFAHMFEHMMFRGSAHVAPEQHMRMVNGVGGITNAFTSFDQTTYVNTVPSEHTEMALWLEADRMASFKVTEDIYRIERDVVAKEWGMRMNQPYGNMYEEFLKNAFVKHSYRWTPIGNMDHLKAAAVNELQDFFNTYYVPNNAILVVAGDIDIAKTKAWVKKYYGWIPTGDKPPRLAPREPEQTEGRKAVVPAAVPLPMVVVGVHIAEYKSDDQYPLAALSEILGGGRSSRLSRRLVSSDTPLATSANTMHMPTEDGGVFAAISTLLAGKNPDEVEKILKEELLAVAEKGVSEEELAKAKAQYRQDIVNGRKTAENIARQLGEEWLWAGDPERANRDWATMSRVTAADVEGVAKKYLAPRRMTVMQMVPDPSGQAAKQAMAAANVGKEVAPPTAPVKARDVKFPEDYPKQPPTAATLSTAKFAKGVEIPSGPYKTIVMTDKRLPIVTFAMVMRLGGHSTPAGKEGLAGIATEMMRRGAGDMTYAQLNELLDSKAIAISVSDGGDHTRLTCSCPSDQLDEAVRIAALILKQPTFPEDEFKKLKAQSMSGLMRSLSSPTNVADEEMDKLLYGDSPLGRQVTPKSLNSITLDDVKEYCRRTIRPINGVLLFAGDISQEQATALSSKLIGLWANGGISPGPAYVFPAADKRQIILVDNPDGKQSAVRMGTRAYTVASNDKYAGSLANQILSGGIESRIMRYVRAEKGYAYHAHVVFQPDRQAGAFIGQTETGFATTADAIEAMFTVVEEARRKGVTADEMEDAKRRVAGRMVMGMQTIEQQAERRIDGILNGYPLDYYDNYAKRVSAVPGEELRSVLDKYADTGKMSIVVVAPAEKVKEQLGRLGEVKVVPMPAKREEMLK